MKFKVIDRIIEVPSGVLGDFDRYINEAKNYRRPSIAQIQRAIENRLYVGMIYGNDGDPKVKRGFRLIEPICVGLGYRKPDGGVKNAKEIYLRAYVIFDTDQDPYTETKFKSKWTSVSKTGPENAPTFRLFKGSSIIDWMPFTRKFSRYRPGYNPDDMHIADILSALDYTDFPYGETIV